MRSAYTDCKWTVRSAKNAGPWLQPHVRERALVQSQTHVTEDPTRCGDKDFRVFFLNGSPVLRNSESRAGFLSTKGHPCTARKVRQALPAWLSRVRSKGLGRSHFFLKISWQAPLTFQNTEDHGSLLVQWHLRLAASPGLSCPLHSKCLCSASVSLLGGSLSWDWGKQGNFLLNSMPLGSHIY